MRIGVLLPLTIPLDYIMERLVSRIVIGSLLVLFASNYSFGQSVKLDETSAISRLMQNYQTQSEAETEIKGYRIQIITTGDRRKSEQARDKFQMMYPHLAVDWRHESPYYRVKAGGWARKIDMQIFLQEIKADFPLAIPVVEKLKEATLLNF